MLLINRRLEKNLVVVDVEETDPGFYKQVKLY